MYPLSYVAITDPLMVWYAITALWGEITVWVLARDACRYLLRGVSLRVQTLRDTGKQQHEVGIHVHLRIYVLGVCGLRVLT